MRGMTDDVMVMLVEEGGPAVGVAVQVQGTRAEVLTLAGLDSNGEFEFLDEPEWEGETWELWDYDGFKGLLSVDWAETAMLETRRTRNGDVYSWTQ
jgi:hypothetical protein